MMVTDAMVNEAYRVFCLPESHRCTDGTFGPKPAIRRALEAADALRSPMIPLVDVASVFES